MDVLIVIGLVATTGMACMQYRLYRQVEELARQRQELLLAMSRLERLAEEFQAVGKQTSPTPSPEIWPPRKEGESEAEPETALSRDFTLPESWSEFKG